MTKIEVFDSSKGYSTRISGAPGVAKEIKVAINELANGLTLEELKRKIVDENLLDKATIRTREKLLSALRLRFLTNPEVNLNALKKLVSSKLNEKIKDLVLYYHFSKSEKLVYDLTIELLYNMYLDGKLMVPKKSILLFLEEQKEVHPETRKWTPIIKLRIAEHYLASLKHFGILKGGQTKKFNVDYIPMEVVMYIVFDLLDKGYNIKQILKDEVFKLFFLDQDDLIRILDEAAREGIVDFKYAENIYSLNPLGKNLEGYVDDITSKV